MPHTEETVAAAGPADDTSSCDIEVRAQPPLLTWTTLGRWCAWRMWCSLDSSWMMGLASITCCCFSRQDQQMG
jgi:hypothetical protein